MSDIHSSSFFTAKLKDPEISEIRKRTEWNEESPVQSDQLSVICFKHLDMKGDEKDGKVIMHESVSDDILSVFRELFKMQFPIHSAIPVHEFDGDDVRSMEANNSSGFNPRKVMGSDKWSSHAYGAAIDINPVMNPYVLIDTESSTAKIYPSGGSSFLNRHIQEAGMTEPVVELFADHGFTDWGGYWTDRLDYHHFQLPWEKIRKL